MFVLVERGMKMKKEDLNKLSDDEIISMIENAKGNTKTEDFKKLYDCDFSYTYLVNYLTEKRGYQKKWVKVTEENNDFRQYKEEVDILYMEKSEEVCVRKSYMLSKTVADEWKKIMDKIPYNTVLMNYALSRTMDDIRKGKVRIEIRL